ncbi:MAG: methionine--tRNA ligase [Kiritimatiellae bacterium]|nr:methionine--tRNA ligase [Kiritimatiellia bacterium]
MSSLWQRVPVDRFYVTTPIYYVNDRPHIGHAYTTVVADVLARYHRLFGVPTFFLTGTDEHGQKVQQAARAAGIPPKEHADRMVLRFQELWRTLGITNDDFIRTTEPRHTTAVQAVLRELYERGEIYRAEYDGWYDVGSETFVTERDLNLPPGRSPADLPGIVRIRETNYFFRMSAYRDWLLDHIESHPDFIRPDFRRNETLGFLRTRELGDLCISRPKSRLEWGIELPFDRDYVCYVWFDALLNYITAIGYGRDEATFRRWWPVSLQLIGKDILTTHSVYWPTMLKALGLPMPRTILAHGWWLMGDTKMSKSLGNVVNPLDMVGRYGVDAFRYFLVAEMTLGQDASFSEAAFLRRYNSDLANDLGNLLSRLVTMAGRYCGGRLPPAGRPDDPATGELAAALDAARGSVVGMLTSYRLDEAVAATLAAVRAINRYLEVRAPWNQAKAADRGPLHATLRTAAEALRICATLLHPVMPGKMGELRGALGLPAEPSAPVDLADAPAIPADAPLRATGPLFPRVEAPPAAAPAGQPPTAAPEGVVLSLEEFRRAELRTARVLSAAPVPNTSKLLKLEIDLGAERRTIVAGIAQHYRAEELVGRTIVVVANLAPAKIRGIESRGMLLAASSGDRLRLVTVDGELPPGSSIG